MLAMRFRPLSRFFWLLGCVFSLNTLFLAGTASAATCTITTDLVVSSAYVTANSCTAINIQGNVSTTWIGTIDLGGGTVTVKSGYTMTMGSSSQMVLGASDDLVIESTGVITHQQRDPMGIQITARNVTVTGSIDASSKGCTSSDVEASNGFGPDLTTGVCTQGASGYGPSYSGGAYGGVGSRTYGSGVTTVYGSSTYPIYLGSSGGSASSPGGGRVSIIASGTLTINGTVKADSGTRSGDTTGGSGGSVYIKALTLAGTGAISANGGNGTSQLRGGGGGGRIAIYYSASTFVFNSASVSVQNGARGNATADNYAKRGTTFILDRQTDDGTGNLTFASGALIASDADLSRTSITVATSTVIQCDSSLGSAVVSSTQVFRMHIVSIDCTTTNGTSISFVSDTGIDWQYVTTSFSGTLNELSISSPSLSVSSTIFATASASSVRIDVDAFTNSNSSTFINSKASSYTTFDVSQDLTLTNFTYQAGLMGNSSASGSHVFFSSGSALSLVNARIYANVSTTVTSLTVDSQSTIDASRMGCGSYGADGTTGYGPHSTTGVCTQGASGAPTTYGGGGYGGVGAVSYGSTAGATYGSSVLPTHVGSSGGSLSTPAGGRILIRATGAVTVSGSIRANAGTSTADITAGSGGTVSLRGSSVTISGAIAANGGNPGGLRGGGGGGRIAFFYSSSFSFSGTSSTTAGAAYTTTPAGAGTVYTLQTNQIPSDPSSLGSSGLVNGSTTGTTTPIFTFTLSDDDILDTVKFQIQIDDSAGFGSPVVDYTSALGAQGSFSFQVGQAAGSGSYSTGSNGQTLTSGSYYWRVKTIDANAAESSYTTANGGSVAFIVDSATRTVSFSTSTGSGLESVTATSIRIVLDTTHFETVTVNYAATGGTADGAGTDYTLASGTAVITAGDTSTTIALTIINDVIDEPNETIVITLSSPVYASIGSTSTYTYSITDNDVSGITFSKFTAEVTEGGSTDSYTVVLDSQPTSTVRLSFATSTFGVTLSTSTVEFTSSTWNTPVSVTVTATNDDVDEQASHTSLVVSTATVPTDYAYGYDSLTLSDITATITDNDTAGVTLSKTTASVAEGGATDSYTLVLTSAPTSTVTVAFSTSTYGVTLGAGTITFTSSNWSTPQNVVVTATDDLIAAGARSTSITHAVSVASGYAYGYSSEPVVSAVTATITDNDTAGVTLSKTTASVAEGGATDSYTLVLTSAPTSTVTVALSSTGSDILTTPSTASFTADTWNIPQAITISAVDDQSPVGARTRTIAHTVLVTGYAYGYSTDVSASSVLVSVTDNDASGGGAPAPALPFIPLPPLPAPIESPLPPPAPTPVPPVEIKPEPVPAAILNQIEQDQREFRVNLTPEQKQRFGRFIAEGTERTTYMNERERRALVRDALDTLGDKATVSDLERMNEGLIPQARNISREREQLGRVRTTFRTLYGRAPNFKNPEENIAWNAMMYRLRFPRNLTQEQKGVGLFRRVFSRLPQDPFQWAVVRVLGYVKT